MTEIPRRQNPSSLPSAVESSSLRRGKQFEGARRSQWVGLPLGCDTCVLPKGYAGETFREKPEGGHVCQSCTDHTPRTFLGGDRLLADLNLGETGKVGVTVSGGKDGLAMMTRLVDMLGPDRVVGFNHEKTGGLVHPIAAENLDKASEALGSRIIRVEDDTMLPRFQRNLDILLDNPDPAMVRVALCAGCRFGISGALFEAGQREGIDTFVNAASYLELAPFKGAIMAEKGGGSERRGLFRGLIEAPAYDHGDNLLVIDRDDAHNQKGQLAGGGSLLLYPSIRFLDFDNYFPNVPEENEALVRERLGWDRPVRSWHFDCQIETFKDAFYYGTLGYTETDGHLSAQIRHGLMDRDTAVGKLLDARGEIIDGRPELFAVMDNLGVGRLKGKMERFYESSPFLNGQI